VNSTADSDQQLFRQKPEPNPSASSPQAIPSNLSTTFKCEKRGRVSFSDKPCSGNERTVSVTTVENTPSTNQNGNLEQMRAMAAAMEASRLEREKQYAAATATKTIASRNANQIKEMRCQQIDREIARVDSLLRQPHSAEEGDFWTGERKKLTDERFSIGC
jgi:hypothetical protein